MDADSPVAQSALDAGLDREILHQLQRRTALSARRQYAEVVTKAVNGQAPKRAAAIGADSQKLADTLNTDGLAPVDDLMSAGQARAAREYLAQRPCFNAHTLRASDKQPRQIGEVAQNSIYGAHAPIDYLRAPHLIETANHPRVLQAAEAYLGCTPTLYSINAWWTFPGHGKARVAQEFHRDPDDYKFCTLFMYLTDVGPQDSPHTYIRRTHQLDFYNERCRDAIRRGVVTADQVLALDARDNYGGDALYTHLFPELVTTITGSAGRSFLADTTGLHRGETSVGQPRLMAWARYGLYRNPFALTNPAPYAEVAGRIPWDERSRYINRCILS